MLIIPPDIEQLMAALEERGHQAYAVGGCVRDSLLGVVPDDWDIATSALPEEVMRFPSEPTGLRYGTVTVQTGERSVQVTTFRREGPYSDRRRPDYVEFVTDLHTDLVRRDFTVNAMAIDRRGQITDPFGGRRDLQDKVIRCVGDPFVRFSEDALRILRALRFAAVLDFTLEQRTRDALLALADTLQTVTRKRFSEEMEKLRCGSGAARVLGEFAGVLH